MERSRRSVPTGIFEIVVVKDHAFIGLLLSAYRGICCTQE